MPTCESDRTVEYYPEAEEYRSSFNPGEKVSVAVVETVAIVKDKDPVNMEALNSVVNPDALDGLFQDTNSEVRDKGLVRFCFEGFRVAVDFSTEEIRLQPQAK